MTRRCPTCDCRSPDLHPAVQAGGEVEICTDAYHLTPTPANIPAFIAAVEAKRDALEKQDKPNG